MDEMPDADEIAALEWRTLAAEEAQDVERQIDGIGRPTASSTAWSTCSAS